MGRTTRAIDIIDAALREAEGLGLCHQVAEDERLDGRHVRTRGGEKLNFGSCSYLGLELDPRLRQGAIDALERYGTQFSSSRGYLSAPLYEELESLLDRIFEAPTLVLPSTTLAHLAGLPVIIEDDDAVVLDHQVHQSVHMAVARVQLQGSSLEIVRHGEIEQLDERIRELGRSHRRVWYLADGIYSMYGDFAPAKALAWLLERHEQLHLYIDDAHGTSWTGRNGRGFAAETFGGHERVVIAASLNKAFGAAGGALVLPSRELQRRVRNCGGPVIFTGPIQPPLLGAAVASARIHLSPEIEKLQAELLERVRLANRLARELDLPLVSDSEVPIRFVGFSKKRAAYAMASHLLENGFYVNASAFPVVGPRNAGVRFTLTRHHAQEDVRALLSAMAEHLPVALERGDVTREQVDRSFGLERAAPRNAAPSLHQSLTCRHETSIRGLDAEEWNGCFAGRGIFDAATLAALEDSFGADQPRENRWKFHYYVVRDSDGRPLLATFFTEALWKDDLLAAAKVSAAVERRRASHPYFLTSEVLAMGCLLSEGNHLFLDRQGDWRGALSLLLAALEEQREQCGARAVVFRDLDPDNEELRAFLDAEGFVQLARLNSMVATVDWKTRDEFLAARTRYERKFHRKHVEPWNDSYDVRILNCERPDTSDREWDHLYGLYANVHGRQLKLNTFPLPSDLLRSLLRRPGWEVLTLTLRGRGPAESRLPQGFVAAQFSSGLYTPVIAGIDYEYVQSHGLYRQLLAQSVWRAQALGAQRVAFGMGSELEKARFGARPVPRVLYVQSHDRYHHDVLELIAADSVLEGE